jgi:flagellar motor switch protein FliN/FliY
MTPEAKPAAAAATPFAPDKHADLARFHDVPVRVQIELGRSALPLRELLALEPGTVIELARVTGQPVDVVIDNQAIARAEIVVADDEIVTRVTEILEEPKAL